MDKYVKNIIEEKFHSKKKRTSRKDWVKNSTEETDKTKKEEEELLLSKEKDVDEIVDELGNIGRSKIPSDAKTKGITQKRTSDQVVKTSAGQMGNHGMTGMGGTTHMKYWGESEIKGSLGYDKTMGDDLDYDDALKYFKDELGLDDAEAEDRMAQLGYDKKLAKSGQDKVRLVENPKAFIESYIDEVILNKHEIEELIDDKEKEVNPIIQKQLTTLKKVMKSNGLSINDVLKYLKDNE